MDIKRNFAVIAAAAIVGALGIGGVVTANADSGSSTPTPSKVTPDTSDGDGEVPDSQETEEGTDGETNDDATDTGPDANPNEPGHQDASDSATDTGDGDGEVPDSQESGTD
ncbi:MAG: hypothetical protein QM572_01475 [Nocardioides sp.]|uniref:hypothetical protein n=1 Tax=Nocardioides sp. TaxID=35761 RepID=UPI0039E3BFA2